MLGYDLFDHDGKHLWRADCWKNEQMDAWANHADQVYINKDAKGEQWSALIAGSQAIFRVDSNGRTIWKKRWLKWGKRRGWLPWLVPLHVQFLSIGKFLPNDPNSYIFLLHCREAMSLLTMDGKLVWRGILPQNWPDGKPACVDTSKFHMGTPLVRWSDPLGTGQDLLVYNEAGWPYAINGFGEKVIDLPWAAEARQSDTFELPAHPETLTSPPLRADDWGYGYHCLVHDINGDGREELLIYDRRYCWVYSCGSA
jgi:hypothetical protein